MPDVVTTTGTALLRGAVSAGLLSTAEIFTGRAYVKDVSGTHKVGLVHSSTRSVAAVKLPGVVAALDGDDLLAGEGRALAALDASGIAPARMVGAPGLWVEAIDGGVVHVAPTQAAFSAWGRALAELHEHPAGTAPLGRQPWVLQDLTFPAHLGGRDASEPLQRLRDAFLAHTDVSLALATFGAQWRTTGWMHGDATTANAILTPSGAVRLIDFEYAGLGDPRWDVATAVECALRFGSDLCDALLDGLGCRPDPLAMATRAVHNAFHHLAAGGHSAPGEMIAVVEEQLGKW